MLKNKRANRKRKEVMTTRKETKELLEQNQEFYRNHFHRFVADRKRLAELLERIQQQDGTDSIKPSDYGSIVGCLGLVLVLIGIAELEAILNEE